MKRLLLFLFLLFLPSAWATTTVTGNMKNLGTSSISGGFVRFWLRGCAGNQPRITGTGLIAPSLGGVFYFDFPANGSGIISGTLYSNRDATGLLGGDIECGGSYTATWYGMQAFFSGKGGPEVAVYAKNGATLDVSNVTPITYTPVLTAPTGDSTYLRLDGGNSPVTGPVTVNGIITAPQGNAINAAAFNSVLNPASCGGSGPPAWCSGSEMGAWINAAETQCAQVCLIQVPAGVYSYTSTINITKPSISLGGAGSYATVLSYTGSGDGIKWQMNPFTVLKAGALRGLSVVCTSAAANCIHSGTLQGSTWDDVMVGGATGAGASCILLENVSGGWTERTFMHNVHIGITPSGQPGCTNELNLAVNGGTNSFGYSDFDVFFNVEANQIGMNVGSSALLYHSNITLKGNLDASPASFLTVSGTLYNASLHVMAEAEHGGSFPNAVHVTSSGQLEGQGSIQISGGGAAGNTYPVQADSGAFYSLFPWYDLSYPFTLNANGVTSSPITTGYRSISADGQVVVAQGNDLQGRLYITWPNNTNRFHSMILDVSCAQFESGVCSLNEVSNYAYLGQAVLSSPSIYLSSGQPQVVVTVGNRNGVTQNMTAFWIGAAGDTFGGPALFPGTAVGGTLLSLSGVTVDTAGNQTVHGGISTTAPSGFFAQGSTAMPTGALAAGACSSAVTVPVTNATTSMRVQFNYHSTPVGVTGYGSNAVQIQAWLTSGNVNFIQCAPIAVTPGAMSVDWTVF